MRGSLIAGGLFVAAGCLHFIVPQVYRRIVPPGLGHQAELVALSGVAEIAGGLGLCFPQTRRAAGAGLVGQGIPVPRPQRFAAVAPAWVLWSRVPLQIPLIWIVERVSR